MRWRARVIGVIGLAGALIGALGLRQVTSRDFDTGRLSLTGPEQKREPRSGPLRAFYSGHSLSDGVPEGVALIAPAFGGSLSFDVQSRSGSTIGERLRPENLDALGLPGAGYDVFVVTERHDLPYLLLYEQSVSNLLSLQQRVLAKSPEARTFLYHVWLEIDVREPQRFVEYERAALVLWECAASAANHRFPQAGIRVLPGATALAELIDAAIRGAVQLPGATPEERVGKLFLDKVHPTPLGRYFMSTVHYAALFGQSPVGAPAPEGIEPGLAQQLQQLAWEHVSTYMPRSAAAAQRELGVCRDYARAVMCPLFAEHPREGEPLGAVARWKQRLRCQLDYATRDGDPF